MFSNNSHNLSAKGYEGSEFIIAKPILYGDSSFLTHSNSLVLKVFVDGVQALKRPISSYPLSDADGSVAEINEKFSGYKELLIEVYDDNPLVSEEPNFNLELEYYEKSPAGAR